MVKVEPELRMNSSSNVLKLRKCEGCKIRQLSTSISNTKIQRGKLVINQVNQDKLQYE